MVKFPWVMVSKKINGDKFEIRVDLKIRIVMKLEEDTFIFNLLVIMKTYEGISKNTEIKDRLDQPSNLLFLSKKLRQVGHWKDFNNTRGKSFDLDVPPLFGQVGEIQIGLLALGFEF